MLMQGQLQSMIGKPSGFIQDLPTKIQGRIEYLRQLQDKHSDLEEKFQDELAALKAKYQTLYGEVFCIMGIMQAASTFLDTGCSGHV